MVNWLIANPKAGDGTRDACFWQATLENAGVGDIECVSLKDRSWMSRIQSGDQVLAAGGDGSVNQAAVLCLETGATLGVLPSGTANDFARNLDLPVDPDALCRLVASGETHWVDVAAFNDRIFLNVAHIGLGTWPVRESSNQTKRLLGRFSYAATLFKRILSKRGFRASIVCQSGNVSGRWLSLAIATGAFFGGGNEIPEASANDGQLDIVAVKPHSLLRLLMTFIAVRLLKRAPRQSDTVVHLKSPWCEIQTRKTKTVTADGDIAGETPLSVICRPHCLQVICEDVVRT